MAIDGLVSGLDTSSIIKQLMQLERLPQDALVARRAKAQAKLDAFASIRSKLSAASSVAASVADPTNWSLRTATSSSPTTATVSATSSASTGSLTFTVDRLASGHAVRSANTIATTDAVVVSGGVLTLDIGDGDPVDIGVGGGTLAEVVNAVNAAGTRVRAAAVNTGSGYHLQLTSTTTGADSTFSVSGLDAPVGGTVDTTAAQDAQLTIGSGPGAYSVTSASNTFADILPGVSITAVSQSASPATITVAEDVDALAKKVSELVDSVNAALGEISTRTAYNSGTKTAASLAGDSTARRAAQELTRALSDAVGALTPSGVGVKLERTGKFTFDAARFKSEYAKDPEGVANVFTRGGDTAGPLEFRTAGNRAVPGTYDVVVTQAAAAASATGPGATWPTGVPSTVVVRVGATEATVDLLGTETASEAADALQAAIDAAGLSVSATTDGSSLTLTGTSVGTASRFEVAWDGTTFTQHQGVDVAGTIDGVAAGGVGRFLTAPSTAPRVGGLSVAVEGTATGPIGTVTYRAGAAQRVASALGRALDLSDGYLTSTEQAGERRVEDLKESIDAFEVRLAARETRLRLYYSNLETALGSLQQQSSWLAGQVAGMYSSGS